MTKNGLDLLKQFPDGPDNLFEEGIGVKPVKDWRIRENEIWEKEITRRNTYRDAVEDMIEKLAIIVPVDGDDKYAEGYRDGLAKAREILGGMLVE